MGPQDVWKVYWDYGGPYSVMQKGHFEKIPICICKNGELCKKHLYFNGSRRFRDRSCQLVSGLGAKDIGCKLLVGNGTMNPYSSTYASASTVRLFLLFSIITLGPVLKASNQSAGDWYQLNAQPTSQEAS